MTLYRDMNKSLECSKGNIETCIRLLNNIPVTHRMNGMNHICIPEDRVTK